MNESGFAAKLKETNPGWLWKVVSGKCGSGIPDRCVLNKASGKVVWLELKFLQRLPKKHCKIGLKPKQAAWLQQWKDFGGNAAVVIGFSKERKAALLTENFREVAAYGVDASQLHLVEYSSLSFELGKIG